MSRGRSDGLTQSVLHKSIEIIKKAKKDDSKDRVVLLLFIVHFGCFDDFVLTKIRL